MTTVRLTDSPQYGFTMPRQINTANAIITYFTLPAIKYNVSMLSGGSRLQILVFNDATLSVVGKMFAINTPECGRRRKYTISKKEDGRIAIGECESISTLTKISNANIDMPIGTVLSPTRPSFMVDIFDYCKLYHKKYKKINQFFARYRYRFINGISISYNAKTTTTINVKLAGLRLFVVDIDTVEAQYKVSNLTYYGKVKQILCGCGRINTILHNIKFVPRLTTARGYYEILTIIDEAVLKIIE